MLADERFSCSDCKVLLNRAFILLCDSPRNEDCDECQFRFQCFSEPVEGLTK